MTQKTTVTTGLFRNRTNENPDEVLAALRSAARDGDSPAKAALAERLLTCPPYSLEEGTSWAVSGAQDGNSDAAHIAVAAVHRIDFMLTWNCKHLANAQIARRIALICDRLGFRMPIICTPEELMGV